MQVPQLFYRIVFIHIMSLCEVSQDIRVHDPVMIREKSIYYLFCTGTRYFGLLFSRHDQLEKRAGLYSMLRLPGPLKLFPGFKGHIWAPDISFHKGQYYLYYSVSAFGKNTSCIGVATNKTFDASSSDFKWTDHGKVIQSIPGRDLWNAIDPNLAFDDEQKPWLTFGSFWSGMKLVKLDASLTKIAEPQEWYTISKRARDFKTDDYSAGEGPVEAPFIFKKNGYYYLFVSFDYCCRGLKSNYKVVVGRSTKIQGPYLDKDGVRMDQGGGSLVIEGNKDWPGVGHNSAYTFDGTDYMVFHAYDAKDEGKPKLKISKIEWDGNGWPVCKLP